VDRPEGDRMILLITDGESADLFNGNEITIARELKEAGITVFAIIIGMDKIQDEIAHITGTTGGEAFEAGDPEALRTVFQRIDKMSQSKEEPTIADVQDNFFWHCALGLGLLGTGLLSLFGIRYTPW
jgi:Ca-activated chloride channel family protein